MSHPAKKAVPRSFHPHPAALFELVNKNGTSARNKYRQHRRRQKKIREIFTEHARAAKDIGLYAVALTLNYAHACSYQKKDITKFLRSARDWLRKIGHGFPYIWVLEKSASGMLHYHLQIWLPRGMKLHHDDLKRWWKQGSTYVEQCKSPKGWSVYLRKMETKQDLPKGARSVGSGGLDEIGKVNIEHSSQPMWLQSIVPVGVPVRRCEGGRIRLDTGEVLRSPYVWHPWGIEKLPLLSCQVINSQMRTKCSI